MRKPNTYWKTDEQKAVAAEVITRAEKIAELTTIPLRLQELFGEVQAKILPEKQKVVQSFNFNNIKEHIPIAYQLIIQRCYMWNFPTGGKLVAKSVGPPPEECLAAKQSSLKDAPQEAETESTELEELKERVTELEEFADAILKHLDERFREIERRIPHNDHDCLDLK